MTAAAACYRCQVPAHRHFSAGECRGFVPAPRPFPIAVAVTVAWNVLDLALTFVPRKGKR